MKLDLFLLSALALAQPGLTADQPYIVTLKRGTPKSTVLAPLQRTRPISITHEWDHALNGFAASFDAAALEALRQDPHVESVVSDGTVYAFAPVTQTNATWGPSRLSSVPRLSNTDTSSFTHSYTYDSSGGRGVDIYVLDTGIRITHNEFEGRARWGSSIDVNVDGNGHGTHVAGSAAGKTIGVAKAANVVAVRVLNDSGSGSVSGVITGLNWVLQSARSTTRPAVVLSALGGSPNIALDSAFTSLLSAGIHVVVGASGANSNSGDTSPQRVPGVINVGASTIADTRGSGGTADIYAPGQNIVSSWHTSDGAANTLSGTSTAAAHVAGLAAYVIGLEGNLSPSALSAKLQSWALPNVLTPVLPGPNLLAHNRLERGNTTPFPPNT